MIEIIFEMQMYMNCEYETGFSERKIVEVNEVKVAKKACKKICVFMHLHIVKGNTNYL